MCGQFCFDSTVDIYILCAYYTHTKHKRLEPCKMNTIERLSPETLRSLINTMRSLKLSEKETPPQESEKHFGIIGGNKIRKAETIPSLTTVNLLLNYDPDAGEFRWRSNGGSRRRIGAIAGAVCGNGYRYIGIGKERYTACHLAWYIHYGVWPDKIVDHINGDKANDSIANLRLVTKQENAVNNKAKRKDDYGVFRDSNKPGRFRVQFYKDGKHLYCGANMSYEQAVEIAQRVRKELGL